MNAPERSIKVTVVVQDHMGLYDDKTRAQVEQAFPAETATLATISAWATRTVANAIRDAQRSFPLAASEVVTAPVPLDKPISEITDEDAAALDAMPF